MLNINHKFVISLIKDNINCLGEDIKYIDCDEVIDILIEHKLFFHYYEKIINLDIFKSYKNVIMGIKNKYLSFYKSYDEFFFKVVKLLSENNIKYRIYKGKVLNTLIYGKQNKRMYSDMDIVINDSYEKRKFISIIKQKFKCYFDFNENIENIHGEISLPIIYDNQKMVIELKNSEKAQIYNINCEQNIIQYDKIEVKTFDLNNTFLLLVNYYYYFTENIFSLQFSKRYILQYLVDIRCFVEKNYNLLDWNKILDYAHKYKLIHKIRLVFLRMYEIYQEEWIIAFLSFFPKELIDYKEHDLIDVGRIKWSIPLIYRYFFKDEIIEFLSKYTYSEFLIGTSNKNYLNNSEKFIKDLGDKTINYSLTVIDKKFYFSLDFYNNKRPDHFAIYIQLYFKNSFNEFIKPFYPIMIRIKNDKLFMTETMLGRDEIKYDYSREKRAKKIKYIKSNIKNGSFEFEINMEKLDINYNSNVGLNFIIHEIDGHTIVNSLQHISYTEQPLIIKKGNYIYDS